MKSTPTVDNNVSLNTLSQYLAELKRNGYIEGTRGVWCKRIFSYSELAILANSIAAVKTVPSIDIQRLIEKLKSMAEPERRKEFCHSYFLSLLNSSTFWWATTIMRDWRNVFD